MAYTKMHFNLFNKSEYPRKAFSTPLFLNTFYLVNFRTIKYISFVDFSHFGDNLPERIVIYALSR